MLTILVANRNAVYDRFVLFCTALLQTAAGAYLIQRGMLLCSCDKVAYFAYPLPRMLAAFVQSLCSPGITQAVTNGQLEIRWLVCVHVRVAGARCGAIPFHRTGTSDLLRSLCGCAAICKGGCLDMCTHCSAASSWQFYFACQQQAPWLDLPSHVTFIGKHLPDGTIYRLDALCGRCCLSSKLALAGGRSWLHQAYIGLIYQSTHLHHCCFVAS